jgi:hypothetical protein
MHSDMLLKPRLILTQQGAEGLLSIVRVELQQGDLVAS